MKQGATWILRSVIVVIGIGALGLLLWEPHIEGRNAHATPFEMYFKDPFLAYAYIAAIPFFVGLYQAFKVVGHAANSPRFSLSASRSLRTIKHCAIAIVLFVAGGEVFIMLSESDDRAGGVVIGILITFAAIVVARASAVLERASRRTSELKSDNDLTA